jgi:hypothetical protein
MSEGPRRRAGATVRLGRQKAFRPSDDYSASVAASRSAVLGTNRMAATSRRQNKLAATAIPGIQRLMRPPRGNHGALRRWAAVYDDICRPGDGAHRLLVVQDSMTLLNQGHQVVSVVVSIWLPLEAVNVLSRSNECREGDNELRAALLPEYQVCSSFYSPFARIRRDWELLILFASCSQIDAR